MRDSIPSGVGELSTSQATAYRDESNFTYPLDSHYKTVSKLKSCGRHCKRDILYSPKKYEEFMEENESPGLRQHTEHEQFYQGSGHWLNSKGHKEKVISSQIAERLHRQRSEDQPSQHHITINTVTRSSPSSVLSFVEREPKGAHITRVTADDSMSSSSNSLHDVHISSWLMEEFIDLASQNTKKDLETCGVLGGFLDKGVFYVTTLIIPKQDSTSNSCQAKHEEEIFSIQHEHSLFPIGWIHTHPSQRCFMSSIDLHTHYPYQVMIPEAFAIVLAPTDSSRNYGIFRLTDPAGMGIIKECNEKEFHNHDEPSDGKPIYTDCTNVYLNSHMRFEIFDLR